MVAQVAGEDAVTLESLSAIECQFCDEPKRPCKMTIGGPLPYSRKASEIGMLSLPRVIDSAATVSPPI